MGLLVMDVHRPSQGHQDVDVQQVDHASSSADLTSSVVIGLVPSGTLNTGNPLRVPIPGLGRRPFLAKSESTLPMETDCSLARLRAARNRSSSITKVVLIPIDYIQDDLMSR